MPALMPSVIRMLPRIRFEMRCVWPTIIASTVVSWSSSAMPMIGPSHGTPAAFPIVFWPRDVPSWMTTIWTLTPSARSRSDSALIRGPSSRNLSPAVAPAETSSGVLSSSAPMTPTWTPPTVNTAEGVTQGGSLAGHGVDDVRRQERELRPRLMLQQPATPKSNSWLPYDVASRPHAFSTSIAGLSSSRAEFGGEAPTLSPAASVSPGLAEMPTPGNAAISSSNIVARKAAPPTGCWSPSYWERRRLELAVEVVQARRSQSACTTRRP